MHDHRLPAAVLFDLDGTLVDSEPYWIDVEMELSRRDGGSWSHTDALDLIGNDLRVSAQALKERGGVKGSIQEIIDDPLFGPGTAASRLILCSGKVYYDLVDHRAKHKHPDTAIVRVEQLYPLHRKRLAEIAKKYAGARQIGRAHV